MQENTRASIAIDVITVLHGIVNFFLLMGVGYEIIISNRPATGLLVLAISSVCLMQLYMDKIKFNVVYTLNYIQLALYIWVAIRLYQILHP